MFNKKHFICTLGSALLLTVHQSALAFEPSQLPDLKATMRSACTHAWDDIYRRLYYLNGQQVESGEPPATVTITEAGIPYEIGMLLWQDWNGEQGALDKQAYVTYALQALMGPNNPELDFETAKSDGAVFTACSIARKDYIRTLKSMHFEATHAFDMDTVRDDDADGFFNNVDKCPDTDHQGIGDGTGEFAIFDSQARYVVANGEHDDDDDVEENDIKGCAAWERDGDGDTVADHYDYCLAVIGAVTTDDGCADADSDGQSDRTDPYPYQNDTMCVP